MILRRQPGNQSPDSSRRLPANERTIMGVLSCGALAPSLDMWHFACAFFQKIARRSVGRTGFVVEVGQGPRGVRSVRWEEKARVPLSVHASGNSTTAGRAAKVEDGTALCSLWR